MASVFSWTARTVRKFPGRVEECSKLCAAIRTLQERVWAGPQPDDVLSVTTEHRCTGRRSGLAVKPDEYYDLKGDNTWTTSTAQDRMDELEFLLPDQCIQSRRLHPSTPLTMEPQIERRPVGCWAVTCQE